MEKDEQEKEKEEEEKEKEKKPNPFFWSTKAGFDVCEGISVDDYLSDSSMQTNDKLKKGRENKS